nr:hypothetical protein [uncultured Sediminibacterium sp.]
MFEKVLKELEELQRIKQIEIPVHSDKDGYIDKECPNEQCLFQFKVLQSDWQNVFNSETVYCPMCRHEANSKSWYTTEQLQEGKEKIKEHITNRIHNAFHGDAISFNRQQSRNSFLRLTMNVKGGIRNETILPLSSKEAMELKIKCQQCSVNYAVIGSAFFCPCCGHNSAEETFANAIKKIKEKIENIPVIRRSLEAVSKDTAAETCRSLIESSLNECVVAFQRFNEVVFAKKNSDTKVRFNAFQNIEAGGEYWKKAIGESYSNWLTVKELYQLNVLFQKRHLLSHTEGIVDQKYIDASADQSYKAGQRIVVKEADVNNCLYLIEKIIQSLTTQLTHHEST